MRHQGLRTADLAYRRRLHQQAADQAPQRQTRHIARPHMHQQLRPQSAHHAALGAGLKLVQTLGVAKVLSHKTLQLGGAKSFKASVQPQTHHLGVQAGDARQPKLKQLALGVLRIQQPGHGLIHRRHDLAHWHGF